MPNHLFAVDSNRHPPQGASTATSGQVLRADGSDVCTWVSFGGDVSGPPNNLAVVDLTIASQATGDILYFNGTNWVRLAIGTAAQVLAVNGGATAPTWVTGGGGGGSGDVVGPASATDNAIVRFDTTTGKLVQNSVVTIGDTGIVAGVTGYSQVSGNFDLTGSGVFTIGSGGVSSIDLVPGSGGLAVSMLDNLAGQFIVAQGGDEYIQCDTNNSSERVTIGSASPATLDVDILAGAVVAIATGTGNIDLTPGSSIINVVGTKLQFTSGSFAIGGNNGTLGTTGVIVGDFATGNFTDVAVFGRSASATGSFGSAFGRSATAGASSVAVGRAADASGFTGSIALGRDSLTTATQQMVVGSPTFPVVSYRLNGTSWTTAPSAVTIETPSVTAGGTSDLAGAPFHLRAGAGVGAGAPGYVTVTTPTIGTTGNAAHAQVQRLLFGGNATAAILGMGNGDPTTFANAAPINGRIIGTTSSTAGTAGASLSLEAGSNLTGSGAGPGGSIDLTPGSTISASTGVGGSLNVNLGTSGAGAGGTFNVLAANTGSPTLRFSVEPDGDVRIKDQLLLEDKQSSPPIAPAAGELRIYGRHYAERMMPEMIGELGRERILEDFLGGNVELMVPSTGATAPIHFANTWSIETTQSTPTPTSTNLHTASNRNLYTTSTTSGNPSGIRGGRNTRWRGNAAGLGGFFFYARVAVSTFQSAMQIVVGLHPQAALAGEPSAINHSITFGKDTADTNWHLMFRDGTTTTKVNLGVAVAANDVFDVWFYAAPNASEVIARVVNVETGAVLADDTVHTANLPGNTTFMSPAAKCRTNAASAVALSVMKIYCRSDH